MSSPLFCSESFGPSLVLASPSLASIPRHIKSSGGVLGPPLQVVPESELPHCCSGAAGDSPSPTWTFLSLTALSPSAEFHLEEQAEQRPKSHKERPGGQVSVSLLPPTSSISEALLAGSALR